MLLKSDFNPKAVSKLMGHAKELITLGVYGDNSNIIPKEVPELLSYMEDVVPKKDTQQNMGANVLDTVIGVGPFLSETGLD